MPNFNVNVVRSALADHFRMVQGEIHELTAPLSTSQLWERPYPYGNSVGNLLLHLTGNLNYYIGAEIAETGYVRHRDQEFAGGGKSKEDLLKDFDDAIETVVSAIASQSDDDWSKPYSATGTKLKDRFGMFLNCAAHASEHMGQIIYLQRELLRKSG